MSAADNLLNDLIVRLSRIDAMAYVIDEQRGSDGRDAGSATEAAITAIRTWAKEGADQIEAFQMATHQAAREAAAPTVAHKTARRSRKAASR